MKKSSLYGSFNNRLISMLIDNILLIFSYSLVFYFVSNDPGIQSKWKPNLHELTFSPEAVLLVFKALFFNIYFPIIHWLYYTLLEASPKQATIGKFTLGLKVTDLRGKRINIIQANLRYFFKLISALPLLLGFIFIFISRRRQMLHDFLARTVIISRH